MKKLPEHAIVVETFEEYRRLIQSWIDGDYDLMLVLGGPGIGKSETIKRLMEKKNGRQNRRWGYIKGRTTPLALYEKLFDYRLLPLVLDDVDGLLKNEDVVTLLKCVCDTALVKIVEWLSKHPVFGKLPSSFQSISPVLIITNSWEKFNQNLGALHSRAVVIAFQPTAIEVHREVGLGGWFDDREVWEFIGRNLYLMVKPDLRFYIHALQHKRAGHPWKDITLRMFESACEETGETREEREKQLYIARLLADPAYDENDAPEADREAAFEFFFGRGGSRASYHRHKKKLLSLRGDFKIEDLIQCPWRATKDEPTEYDLRQTQIRATLENEKTELLRVGGVLGADGDDDDAV